MAMEPEPSGVWLWRAGACSLSIRTADEQHSEASTAQTECHRDRIGVSGDEQRDRGCWGNASDLRQGHMDAAFVGSWPGQTAASELGVQH